MLCHQLRLFVVMAVALVRLSVAAHFDCDDGTGTIVICTVTIHGETFSYSPDAEEPACTEDGVYCVQVTGNPGDASWEVNVTNGDNQCWADCPVQLNSQCDDTGYCWDTCVTDAC